MVNRKSTLGDSRRLPNSRNHSLPEHLTERNIKSTSGIYATIE